MMPETSLEAYKSLHNTELCQIYKEILRALSSIKEGTYEQISEFLLMPPARIWKRMSDLHKMGLIYRPGNKRLLKSGRNGFTWKLTNPTETPTINTERFPKGKSSTDYAKDIIKQSSLF